MEQISWGDFHKWARQWSNYFDSHDAGNAYSIIQTPLIINSRSEEFLKELKNSAYVKKVAFLDDLIYSKTPDELNEDDARFLKEHKAKLFIGETSTNPHFGVVDLTNRDGHLISYHMIIPTSMGGLVGMNFISEDVRYSCNRGILPGSSPFLE